jgi:hypothetical protein
MNLPPSTFSQSFVHISLSSFFFRLRFKRVYTSPSTLQIILHVCVQNTVEERNAIKIKLVAKKLLEGEQKCPQAIHYHAWYHFRKRLTFVSESMCSGSVHNEEYFLGRWGGKEEGSFA